MDPFKSFFNLDANKVKKRHQKPILGGGLSNKHSNVVAARYKADNSKNHKIELLKKKPGKFHCDQKDLDYIRQTFLHGVLPGHHEMKVLGGKMGIKMYFDRHHGKWVIEKN